MEVCPSAFAWDPVDTLPVFLAIAQTFLTKPNNVCLVPLRAFFADFITVWDGYFCSDLQFHYAI